MAKVTRIDKAGTFYSTFVFTNGNESNEISVLASEADAIQTKIENATWAQINAIYNNDSATIIKEQ